jgi:hypothetical protein
MDKSGDSRTILADNLRRMIEAEGSSVRAWALSRKLDVRLIDRLAKGENAATLDKLEEIAEAIGCKPWHLLLEDFDPKNPPEAPITPEEREMLARLRRLLGPGSAV